MTFVSIFLQNIYRLVECDLQTAVDELFDKFDDLLLEQKFDVCNDILKEVDIDRLGTKSSPCALMRSILAITFYAKDRLPEREKLFDRIYEKICGLKGKEKADCILENLK